MNKDFTPCPLTFNSAEEFCNYIVENKKDVAVSIVAKYDVMKEIFEQLHVKHSIQVLYITEFGDPSITNYEDKYILEFWDNTSYLQPFKVNCDNPNSDEYYITGCDELFVHGDCNSKILSLEHYDTIIPFNIGETSCPKFEFKGEEKKCCKEKCEKPKTRVVGVVYIRPHERDLLDLFRFF